MLFAQAVSTQRAMSLMTEEPNPSSDKTETAAATVPKQLIDRPQDFRFHAAYLVYSDAWDKAASQEAKLKLNEIISALSSEQIDYDTFYREISQYRGFKSEHFNSGRAFIETQRKKDWRRREEREGRNKRHGR